MKQKAIVVLLLLVMQLATGQNLYVGSDSALTLETGSIFTVDGLVLSPSADFELESNTTLTRLSTPATTGNLAINRQYVFNVALTGYLGGVDFNYEDSELNGVLEDDLTLRLLDASTTWQGYNATQDTDLNVLSYTFTNAVDFSVITADDSETLGLVPSFSLRNIRVYPNPTTDYVYIDYPKGVRTVLYDSLGRELQRGNSHSVDLSPYEGATYLLIIQDITSNASTTVKIIKE
ncbi:T9SS type A sorting domain-containing protein [Winogradskyella sp.]|nr:T9SS type A sorting domain-containing protein [Winogradskyella sp.]MDC0009003.1 T9SS type A sorting domain-containing protein [Winogradskyella sp.]MDC1505594.1 T9SS type A sorting domain-containing protein [Winogradskyella sp.]